MNKCLSGHTSLVSTCKHCEDLKNHWEQKLVDSGFEDIEKENVFFSDSKSGLKKATATVADSEAVMSYYSTATSYLYNGTFKDKTERRAWEMHAEGLPMRRIGSELGLSVRAIFKRIDRVKKRAFKS